MNADAKSVEVAIAAYQSQNGAFPTTTTQLTGGTGGTASTQYLRTWPANTAHYNIVLGSGGAVYVNAGTGTSTGAAYSYDSTTNPCNAAGIK